MAQMKQEYILKAVYEGKGEIGRLRQDLDSLGNIQAIKTVGKDIRELTGRFNEAKQKLEEQARQMQGAATVTKEMTAAYTQAQREVVRLAAALDKKKTAFRNATAAARESGVDTKNLAAEERRLTESSRATGAVWAARQTLGVKSHRDIREEVARLNLAYQNLKNSGKATASELYAAKQHLLLKTRELTAGNNIWALSWEKVKTSAVAMAAVALGAAKAFGDYAAVEKGFAEISTLVDVSTESFARFKAEAKGIMGNLPQETKDLTKSLYDIMSSGVKMEDANKVLELSAKAATAGVAETKDAVTVGVGALNAYGLSVDNLAGIYDTLFQTVKFGVTTFPELAQQLGEVLPTARAANVDLKNVSASIAALTLAGIKTPQAATALRGAILAMAAPAPEAKKKFYDLGITWKGLLPTLDQIRQKGLSIDQMRELIPDQEGAKAVLSLTQNFDRLKEVMASMDQAGGSMEAAYKKMAATPSQQIDLMKKSLHQLSENIGHLASIVIIPAARTIKFFVDAINNAPGPVKTLVAILGTAAGATLLWKAGLGSAVTALSLVASNIGKVAASTLGYNSAMAAARAGVAALSAVVAANPVGAAITGLIIAASAAWALFGKDSLQASRDHAEAARKIGESRKQIDNEIISLEKLRKTFNESAPGSTEYLAAERELAKILPGVNISLDEHGQFIAKVGDAASENSKKLDEYIKKQKEQSSVSLALQLEQQAKAFANAKASLQDYTDNLKNWYGIGAEAESWSAPIWRAVNKLTGTYDGNIKKGEEVRANLGEQREAYNNLIQSIAKTGLTAEQLSSALDKAKISAELKQSIISDYEKLSGTIKKVGDAAKDSAEQQEAAFANAAANIKDEYLRLAETIKKTLDDINSRQMDLNATMREMGRGGMSGLEAWRDLKKEAGEYAQAARDAMAAGKYDEAAKLADRAKDKYKELNKEVRDGKKVVVDDETARKEAMKGVKESAEIAIEALKKKAEADKDAASKLEDQIGIFKDGWHAAFEAFLEDGRKSIQNLEKELDSFVNKKRTVSVNFESSGSSSSGYQNGGLIALRMASGGTVALRNMLTGGHFPGFGGGDRRHVVAEDGEYMLDKYRVRDAGLDTVRAFHAGRYDIVIANLMERLKQGRDMLFRSMGGIIEHVAQVRVQPQYLSTGGEVTAALPVGATFNLTFNYSGPASQAAARDLARTVMSELQKMHRGRS